MTAAPRGLDLVILLNSTWSSLEDFNTRWRALIQAFAQDPGVRTIDVIDYPRFERSAMVRRGSQLLRSLPSWDGRVNSHELTVPVGMTRGLPDRLGWWRAAHALEACLRNALAPRVVIATTPLWVPLLVRVPATTRVFDAVDDWRHYGPVQPLLERVEEGYRLAHRADLVTAVSGALADELRDSYGLEAEVVPNGVSLDAYGRASDAPPDLPEGPFAVYVGTVEERVDVSMLAAAAGLVPDVPIVVAGPAGPEAAQTLLSSGCKWIGPIPARQVPGLLQRASVGLLPHLDTGLSRTMAPMKLLEYLAAGLPVVATPLPSVTEFRQAVELVESAEELAAAITRLSGGGRNELGRRLVEERDWGRVASSLLAQMQQSAYAGGASG